MTTELERKVPTLSLGKFTGITIHDVNADEVARVAQALFDQGGRCQLLLSRLQGALARDAALRYTKAELAELGISSVSVSFLCDEKGASSHWGLQGPVLSLSIDRTREGAMSLHLNVRAWHQPEFERIAAAVSRLDISGLAEDAVLELSDERKLVLPGVPRAHEIHINDSGGPCGC